MAKKVGNTMKICKICNGELIWNNDYSTTCHNVHKMTHHECWSNKSNGKARKDFENS